MNTLRLMLLILTIGSISLLTVGQETRSIEPAQPNQESLMVSYLVEHDHGIGSGRGELHITSNGISFHSTIAKEVAHNRIWKDADIKRLEISPKTVRVVVYEGGRIVLLPGHFPFGKNRKGVPNGTEHDYNFHLVEGEITPDVVQRLLARFHRPLITSVTPAGTEISQPLFDIPVFHHHRAGGESGRLQVFQHYVLFQSDNANHSRWWRYSDIRDIGRIGRFQFEVATYEGGFGTDGRSFIFDLKRPMTDVEYEILWKKLYGQRQ